MTTIHLEPAQVPAALRGSYSGKKFKAKICDSVTIPMDAGLWSGGSRDVYSVVSLDTGSHRVSGQDLAPWAPRRGEHVVTLTPSIVVVEHSMFCGKDMGLTFYVHPDSAQKLLPAPAGELLPLEKTVLNATASFKSSYMGKDRYDMARDNARYTPAYDTFASRADWDVCKQSLIAKGYLNKAGTITTAGRNALGSRY